MKFNYLLKSVVFLVVDFLEPQIRDRENVNFICEYDFFLSENVIGFALKSV